MTRAPQFFLLALLAGFTPVLRAQVAIPKLEARVTDLTGTLTAAQQSALDEKLAAFESRKGSQIAVLMLPSTSPEDIAQFGYRLAEAWKIGRKGSDDGAILIVAKSDGAMRIEVGRGLEGALPDALAGRIVYDTIAPLFKQGDFYGGINAGLDQMIRVIDGETLPTPDNKWKSRSQHDIPWPLVIFACLFFASFLNRIFGRVGGSGVTGVVGAAVTWWLTAQVGYALLGLIGFFLLGLLFGGGWSGGTGGRGVYRDMRRGGGFGGFGGFGGGGFGGGGGGFSGGGGSFGGGGASGRW